ncbi:MAG: acyl-ACP--UDP-N-acetylglucosamine O-acyltransferase [Deltaproteobacteria bacterium]
MEIQNHDLIHPTAIIHSGAKLGKGTRVGPFSVISSDAIVGDNCEIQENVIIRGRVTLGNDCKVFPFSVLGGEPQHLGYKNEPTEVVVGDRVVFRESVTVHRGTVMGGGVTRIGSDCLIMAYVHVGHDCHVGNKVIIVNASQLAGHVIVEDFATVGGQTGVVQHCRVGRYCYIGGGSLIRKDLPPFLAGKGNDFQIQGINRVGMERAGIDSKRIADMKEIYKIFLLQNLTVSKALEKISVKFPESEDAKVFLDFVKSSKVGVHR